MKELKDGDNEKDKVIFSKSSVKNVYLGSLGQILFDQQFSDELKKTSKR